MNKNITQNPNINTLVFTGPSLPPEEARLIFPNAYYHEPIQCGDVIKAMRAGMRNIAIIDGYFEQRGAVWHKEIIFALSRGVQVFGSSSMGALRAAELHPFGMIGFGKVFEDYRDNIIIDDDEVALVHAARFDSHITPMVNIRATLTRALGEKEISQEIYNELLSQLKATPYYNRSIFNASQDPQINQYFQDHYVDQKGQDARDLLQALSNDELSSEKINKKIDKKIDKKIVEMPGGVFFNRIFREMIVEPFDQPYPWLPDSEKQMVLIKNKSYFSSLQRIAKCLHLGLDISIFEDTSIKINPSDAYAYLLTLQSFCPVDLDTLTRSLEIENGSPEDFQDLAALKILANVLMGIIGFMTRHDLSISAHSAQKYADDFRRTRQLNTGPLTLAWMEKNGIPDQAAFEHLIMTLCPLHHIIDLHNGHSIGLNTSLICHDWTLDAYHLFSAVTSEAALSQ